MKTSRLNLTLTTLLLLGLALVSATSARAASINTGYVVGQIFPSFVDKSAAGDADNTGNLGFTVQMTNLWQPGQTIRITGLSWPTRSAPVGTFTFSFYDLDQGASPNAFDGNGTETLIGTNTATLGTAISAGTAAYCIFDQPIVFTANSAGIAVTWVDSGGNQIVKVTPNTAYTNIVRVNTTTGVPIGGVNPYLRFSLFGSVVQPAPTGSLTWQGNLSTNWDGTTTNWNLALGGNLFAPTNYTDNGSFGPMAIFDDTLVSPFRTNINLTTGTPLRPSALVFNNSVFNYNFSGPGILTGPTILTNSGSGVVTLNTANNFTGGSVLTGGRIRLANVGGLGAGAVTFHSGALSSVGATPLTITNSLSLIGTAVLGNTTDNGTLTCNGQMDFNGGIYGIDAENKVILTGVLTNGGIGAKSGPGTLTLTGGLVDNESAGTWAVYNGNFIVDGVSVTRAGGAISVGASAGNGVASFVVTNGASVTLSVTNPVAVGTIGQSANTSSNYFHLSGTLAYATTNGFVLLGQSSAYDEFNMRPGSLLQVGGITYNLGQALANVSVLNINGGTITAIRDNNSFLSDPAQPALIAATYVQAGGVTFDSGAYSITVAQPLLDGAGGGGLTKIGNGTLNLNGVNTYTGLTTVSAGTLGGTGVVSGPVTFGALGTLSPGNSVGTFTVSNNLTLGGNTLIEIDVSLPESNDVVNVTGTLAYGGGTITVTNLGPALNMGDAFKVFPAGGTGSYTIVGDPGSGNVFSLDKPTGIISVVASGPASTNSNLSNLVLAPLGPLSPTFASNVLSYTATESYLNTPITVTPTSVDANAVIQVIYAGATNVVLSGNASGPLNLDPNPSVPNVVNVRVTGSTTNNYVVTVTRQPSQVATNLVRSLVGNQLTLSWPVSHTGWSLQTQTNSRAIGLSSAWFTVAGSTGTNALTMTVSPTDPTVFFRIRSP